MSLSSLLSLHCSLLRGFIPNGIELGLTLKIKRQHAAANANASRFTVKPATGVSPLLPARLAQVNRAELALDLQWHCFAVPPRYTQ